MHEIEIEVLCMFATESDMYVFIFYIFALPRGDSKVEYTSGRYRNNRLNKGLIERQP